MNFILKKQAFQNLPIFLSFIILIGFASNPCFAQIAEFEGTARSTAGVPEFQLYDNRSSENRIEGRLRENGDDILLESLYGDLNLSADTSGFSKQRMLISGSNSDIGIRLTPKETCSNTEISSMGITIRRKYIRPILLAKEEDPKKSKKAAADCFNPSDDYGLELYPDNYSNNRFISSSLGLNDKRWSNIFSITNYSFDTRTNTIRFNGINSGLGDGVADDGVLWGPYGGGSDIFARVNDAFIVRINDNNSSTDVGDFVVSSPTKNDILQCNSNGWIYAKHLTFGDYANMQYRTSDGRFFYDNSSARFKENITTLKADFKQILNAKPVTYTRPDNPERWEIGYVAEDMEELGMEELLSRDAEGKVDNFNYEKMILYVVEVLKDHEEQINDQQKIINKLSKENELLRSQRKNHSTIIK